MPRTNTTRFVILGLLGMRPSSGYEIRKDLGEVMGYFWNESFGQIYPALRRLEAERLVERSTERNGARARHVYRVTPRGRAELKRWLAEPVRPEPVRRELLLKLFFGRNVTPKVLLAHVRAQRERALQLGRGIAATESQVLREANGSPDLPYWLLTIRFGKEMSRALVTWADATLAELEKWSLSRAGVARGRSGRGRTRGELATLRQRRPA
jgi:DNA-binding PadR family transcriptional regulator